MDLPNLSGDIALDIETRDGGLANDVGPGWAYKGHDSWDGEIVGYAIACEQYPQGAYFPIAHEGGDNLNPVEITKWLKAQLENAKSIIVANAQYEIGWCRRNGIDLTKTRIHDVLAQEALLDEHQSAYDLDSVALRRIDMGKDEELLQSYGAEHFGLKKPKQIKSNLWKFPGKIVEPYASQDAFVTLELFKRNQPFIEQEELQSVYDLECALFACLVEMRWRGVRVDLEKAERIREELLKKEELLLKELKWETGYELTPSDPKTAVPILKDLGIRLPKTPTGRDSVKADFLESLTGDIPEKIVRARKIWKARTTFIELGIFGFAHNGRIHSELNSVKGEFGGTIGGRFSSRNPNLQQIPARDPELGPLIRSIYFPEEENQWAAIDFSSQEPRLTVHYANLANVRGGPEAAQRFIDDPHTDLHQMVADLCEIARKDAKQINLGLTYGMGSGKLARKLGLPTEMKEIRGRMFEVAGPEGQILLQRYHENAPFVGKLIEKVSGVAARRGFVRTLLGRKCRFPKKPNGQYDWTHKALNRIIQGSAADYTKKAMLDLWDLGIVPLVSVHDELGFSVANREEAEGYAEVMCNAIPISIPMLADIEIGNNWGDSMVKESI